VAYTPYQRPPDNVARTTAIPRGLLSFVLRGAATAAKPATDTYLLTINATLPAGFGYVLNEIHLNLVVDRAPDFNGTAVMRLSQPSNALRDFDYRMPLAFSSFSINGGPEGAIATGRGPQGLMRTPIVPPRDGSTFSLSASNPNTTAMAVGTADAVISFWEYDLQQLQYYFVHMASAVSQR